MCGPRESTQRRDVLWESWWIRWVFLSLRHSNANEFGYSAPDYWYFCLWVFFPLCQLDCTSHPHRLVLSLWWVFVCYTFYPSSWTISPQGSLTFHLSPCLCLVRINSRWTEHNDGSVQGCCSTHKQSQTKKSCGFMCIWWISHFFHPVIFLCYWSLRHYISNQTISVSMFYLSFHRNWYLVSAGVVRMCTSLYL